MTNPITKIAGLARKILAAERSAERIDLLALGRATDRIAKEASFIESSEDRDQVFDILTDLRGWALRVDESSRTYRTAILRESASSGPVAVRDSYAKDLTVHGVGYGPRR